MKDVKYKDSDWQSLSEGIIQLTSSGLFEWITEADKISDEATDSCDTYDVDCAITIDTAGNATYDELENRFTLLQQAIQHIPDTLSADVDYPFYNELDGVLEKMSNMNIMGYETMARGSFSNGVNSAGVPTQKMKVTLDDILGSSSPLSDYLRVEYNEKKKQLGDVSYEDYQKMAFADTSFDYYSKGEKIKDLGVTLLVNGALIAVGALLPWPIMVALGFASAGKNGYDAVTGKDLFTGKELTTGDRILRGLSGVADLALAVYGTYKGVQAIKGTNKVVSADNKKNIDIDDVVDANDIIKNSKNGKNYALDKNKSAGNKTYKNGSVSPKVNNVPESTLNHADFGEFNSNNRLINGGHGQTNIDYLKNNNIEYNIVKEYPNGVRVGNIPSHKNKMKRTGTGQSWFPESWDKSKINNAGNYINDLPANKNLPDGQWAFGEYDGVRVGIIKKNGKPSTIIPDNSRQP